MFDVSDKSILANFPFTTPRAGQVECIRFILEAFNSGKRFVMLEAPTGSGKSAIGITVARFFKSSYYLTPQKLLEDQLVREFGENGSLGHLVVDLKGRNAYQCPYYSLFADQMRAGKLITEQQYIRYKDEKFDCSEGHCRTKGKYQYPECIEQKICPYAIQKEKAQAAPICVMNFAGFLSHTSFTENFDNRELLITDEAHSAESSLLGFISLTISQRDFGEVEMPQFDTPEEYARWMDDSDLILLVEKKKQLAEFAQDTKRVDELISLRSKITWFINEMTASGHDPWVCEYVEDRSKNIKIVFKPIYVRKHANKYLFSMADRVLMMSATILNVNIMANSLGIRRDEMAAKRIGSTFPVENRPVYYMPVVKVTGGNSQISRWGPPLIDAVEGIVKKYSGRRGIIHTHNFAIAQMLIDECCPEVSGRFLFQRNFPDKNTMLEAHSKNQDTVIVAPAMHEGLDLKDDLSRFQIICKLPFPNFYEDKQLAARKDVDSQYIDWMVALKLAQSIGRSVRSETDWADTYIIDESFGWWYKRNDCMIPTWLKEAIRNKSNLNEIKLGPT